MVFIYNIKPYLCGVLTIFIFIFKNHSIFSMNRKVLIPVVIALGVAGYFGYQQMMKPSVVGLSGKAFDDSKAPRIVSGMPLYNNMLGKWSNDKKSIEIKDGKFIETVGGQTKEYDFMVYANLPEACFPDKTAGNALGFTVRSSKEVRCFGIRALQPTKDGIPGQFGFTEITTGEDVIEMFHPN
jgi:hypothetical protein